MLGERIKILREQRKMSQDQLGAAVGVTKQTVSNWENGNITPAMDKFTRLIEFFHTTPNYILGFDERYVMDLSGLSDEEITHLQMLVGDLKELHKKAEQAK